MPWELTGNSLINSATDFLGTTDGQPLIIETNGLERLRITPDGKVGMGTSQPDTRLQITSPAPQVHVTGTDATHEPPYPNWGSPATLRLTSGSSWVPIPQPQPQPHPHPPMPAGISTSSIQPLPQAEQKVGIPWDIMATASDDLQFSTSLGAVMRITAVGNVGIGTKGPQRRLQVDDDVAGIGFDPADSSPNAGYIRFGDNTGWKLHFGRSRENAGGIINKGTTGLLMTIQDNGNVGIGIENPSYAQLHVSGQIATGRNGTSAGAITFFPPNGSAWFHIDHGPATDTTGRLRISYGGKPGDYEIMSLDQEGNVTIPGDIVLTNADCAEEFDVEESVEVEPGTVMVLDQEGTLCQSESAYDKRVVGVISGAGDYKPGIILGKQQLPSRKPIALAGKVYCKVDASCAPIEVGDLLTTSSTPGCAMKATDRDRAFGTVIGKALSSLDQGCELIPIFVALQ